MWNKSNPGMFRHIFRCIQGYSEISRYNQAYSGIFGNYSDIVWTLCNSVIFRTLTYSELWYIQNPGIFKTRVMFRILVYLKLWLIQNQKHIQNAGLVRTLGYSTAIINFPSFKYFHDISCSCPLVHDINMIFNAGLMK